MRIECYDRVTHTRTGRSGFVIGLDSGPPVTADVRYEDGTSDRVYAFDLSVVDDG